MYTNNNRVTVTSMLESELLASVHEQNLHRREQAVMPTSVTNADLRLFIDREQPSINKDVGYMFIKVDREHYSPGQTVFGSVFFELFRIGYQTNLLLRVEGHELLPKRLASQIYQAISASQDKLAPSVREEEEGTTTFRPRNASPSKEVEEQEEVACLFRVEQRIFTFRSKHAAAGQYEFPFSFRLPHKLPSSFHFINSQGESYQVKYSITCCFEGQEPILSFEKQIAVL